MQSENHTGSQAQRSTFQVSTRNQGHVLASIVQSNHQMSSLSVAVGASSSNQPSQTVNRRSVSVCVSEYEWKSVVI